MNFLFATSIIFAGKKLFKKHISLINTIGTTLSISMVESYGTSTKVLDANLRSLPPDCLGYGGSLLDILILRGRSDRLIKRLSGFDLNDYLDMK